MGYKATRNTYAIDASSGVEVRRLVKAGAVFPHGYEPETASDVEQTDEAPPTSGQVVGGSASVQANTADSGELKGEALDKRAAELDIEGRSDMSADEKRQAIAEAEAG